MSLKHLAPYVTCGVHAAEAHEPDKDNTEAAHQ